ncbi:DUF2156 domain-containing protein [Thermotalea metallivorans]|uniref:Phosphatidylglycerol lysyltransferase C-terminal domain-containing protein n=1 Tax=Thermotalea metallivorans TaxID=520762 RepID=A0A140L6G3_9FIRM|nr:phosphatidylglycerol lysyltransferase domain-containing protein [Thermotalea metallivorans]KXG76138.1 hypothetical protein AN619_10950 [Thermotalea metallivorans]
MLSHDLSIKDKEFFDAYLKCNLYGISDLNFTNLFMWRHLYQLKYEILHGLLWISGMYYDKPFLFPPLFKESHALTALPRCLDLFKKKFDALGHRLMIKFVPSSMKEFFEKAAPNQLIFVRDRNNDDYIYLARDLIELKGRKFHGKKNHFNYFQKNIPYQYKSLTYDLIEDCLILTGKLKEGNYTPLEMDLLQNEEKAIQEALYHMDQLDYSGGVILIEGRVEAFTFGEKLTEDTMVIHIEKANANIRGLYQAINQQFCYHQCQDVLYVNREEDMGFDYLRKAKESYNPIKMIEKYDIFLR